MPSTKKTGRFITLEGGEGAGKSTQSRLLADYLRGQGHAVVQTREVGGCPSAEAIRKLWLEPAAGVWDAQTELLLIFAARREHWVKTIRPALERGAYVVCDRFTDSTRAYQGIALGVGLERVNVLQQMIGAVEPDLTLLLDLPVAEGMARVQRRAGPDDRYQQKDAPFHQVLRDAYLDLANADPARFMIINAAQSAEQVAKDVQQSVGKKLGESNHVW